MAEVFTKSISDYFPMQEDMNFPKLFLHTRNIIGYQLFTGMICRNCDKNHVFCAKVCDKNRVENFVNPNMDTYFRVKGKRMAHLRLPEICREKVIFQSRENSLFHLESFQAQIAI